ncbi:MAG: dihydrofolate reductase family protein [Acidimicrobiales bacterium]
MNTTDPPELRPEAERNDDVVASLALTLDGYVCRPDGEVDYLENHPIDDFDFGAWSARIGALVMGRASYEQTVGWGWTWGDLPTLVLTSATDLPIPEGADVRFKAAPTAEAITEFSAEIAAGRGGRIWVFGGGKVVTEALLGGVVDTLDVVIVPEAIGEGIPLYAQPFAAQMRVLEAVPFAKGAIRIVYDVARDLAGDLAGNVAGDIS